MRARARLEIGLRNGNAQPDACFAQLRILVERRRQAPGGGFMERSFKHDSRASRMCRSSWTYRDRPALRTSEIRDCP